MFCYLNNAQAGNALNMPVTKQITSVREVIVTLVPDLDTANATRS